MIEAKIRVIDRYGGSYIPQQNRRECIFVKYNGLLRLFYKGRVGGISSGIIQVSCTGDETEGIKIWIGNKKTLLAFCVAICYSEEQAHEQYNKVTDAVYSKASGGCYEVIFDAIEKDRLIPPTEEQKNFQK